MQSDKTNLTVTISQDVLLENSSNLFPKFQFKGHELDHLTGKLIHVNFMTHELWNEPVWMNSLNMVEFSGNTVKLISRKFADKD